MQLLDRKMVNKEANPFLNTYYTRAKIYNAIGHQKYDNAYKLALSIYSKIKEANQSQILMELEKLLATIEEKEEIISNHYLIIKNMFS